MAQLIFFVQSSLVCSDINSAQKVFDDSIKNESFSLDSLIDGYVKHANIELAMR